MFIVLQVENLIFTQAKAHFVIAHCEFTCLAWDITWGHKNPQLLTTESVPNTAYKVIGLQIIKLDFSVNTEDIFPKTSHGSVHSTWEWWKMRLMGTKDILFLLFLTWRWVFQAQELPKRVTHTPTEKKKSKSKQKKVGVMSMMKAQLGQSDNRTSYQWCVLWLI